MALDKVTIAEGCLSVAEDEKKALTEKAVTLSNLLRVANDSMTSAEMRLAGAEERATAAKESQKAVEARAESAEARAREVVVRASRAVFDYK